jgi:hypothetical protein
VEVYIPTLGRRNVQETWENLPRLIRSVTKFVVPPEESHLFDGLPCVILPPGCRGIGRVRQHIIDISAGAVLMLDDDLRFATRRQDDPTKFEDASEASITLAFGEMFGLLTRYALVGMSTREGGNRDIEHEVRNTRILRVLGYRADILRRESIRFDRVPVMEDFDVALQLLEKGYENVRVNWIVHDQRGSNLAGGCSTYRTMDVQADAARMLAELHPRAVTVVQKSTKTAWGGGTRTDVRIQWKQALGSDGTGLKSVDSR